MTVEEAAIARSPIELRNRVARRLKNLNTLPTTVAVAVRLFGLKTGEDADAGQYARVIASDAGLTARILGIANSSWFGLTVRITQPTVAINLLGIPAVRTLAINFCLAGLHHELRLGPVESHHFWEASLCKAVVARAVARRLDPGGGVGGASAAEAAYVAGPFQDIALPVMFATAREPMGQLLETRMSTARWLHGERAIFGVDHTDFGRLLAQRLGLSDAQVRLVAAHHDPDALQSLTKGVAGAGVGGDDACVRGAYAASLFPHRLDHWDAVDVESLRQFLASDAGGNMALEPFLQSVSEECRQEFAYFDRAKVNKVRLLELVAHATSEAAQDAVRLMGTVQEMKNHVATAEQSVTRLSQERSRLAEEATRDALTGVLNRAGFEKESRRALALTQAQNHPVALLFIDVDNFKEINDISGHATGDDALRQIVALIRECTRTTDLVGRLGGDEFAVLLPNCPCDRSAEIAEHIRDKVRTRKIEGRRLTVSIGIHWAPPAVGPTPVSLEFLLAAADQHMYAAKRTGGNTVHVHAA